MINDYSEAEARDYQAINREPQTFTERYREFMEPHVSPQMMAMFRAFELQPDRPRSADEYMEILKANEKPQTKDPA